MTVGRGRPAHPGAGAAGKGRDQSRWTPLVSRAPPPPPGTASVRGKFCCRCQNHEYCRLRCSLNFPPPLLAVPAAPHQASALFSSAPSILVPFPILTFTSFLQPPLSYPAARG